MKRLVGASALGAVLTVSATAFAQAPQTAPAPANADSTTRAATTTASGTTGLWYVPTSDVLPARMWSASFYRTNIDDGQGFTDVSTFPATVAFGVADRFEIFGSWALVTRIDRDTRPLFFAADDDQGSGGGIMVDYPFVRSQWIGNKLGDLWLGGKVSLVPPTSASRLGVAARAMVKVPVGDDKAGASSGSTDFQLDGIVSVYHPAVEISGYGGILTRGNPDGYELTNGFRWGVGVGSPQRYNLGFRLTAELFGESYFDDTITAPAGQFGVDGSPVPTVTNLRGPAVASVGVTWQAPNGFFAGAAASWNLAMEGRDEAGFPNTPKDDKGLQFRIGFHPGARDRAATAAALADRGPSPAGPGAGGPGGPGGVGVGQGPAPTTPAAPATPTPVAQNRPPTVRATCNPCTVEVGRAATVTADAQDPDGDPLTYQWTVPQGTLASPTSRQSGWTAPMQPGAVPFTVTVNDGKGGTASANVTIQVTQPAQRQIAFEDVHFEFDRFNLRTDALRILDEAVSAMQANPTLRLRIEGHTCNIGTAEYNLALGERRAQAVRTYLVSRGVAADRLSTVSYGEERPKHDNSREDTRRLNRRAALVVNLQ